MATVEQRRIQNQTERWKTYLREALPDITDGEMNQIVNVIKETKGRASRETLLNAMRSMPSHKVRYPAFSYMYNNENVNSERQYRSLETNYRRTMVEYLGEAAGPLATPEKLAQLMTNDVSPDETRDRLVQASNLLTTAGLEYNDSLRELYGIDDNYQLAFLIDPETAKPMIDKMANDRLRAATLATRAAQEGLRLDREAVLNLADETQSMFGDLTVARTDVEVSNKMKQAALLAQQDRRLAAIEGQQYRDVEAVEAAFGDVEAALSSQRRGERERARFGGTSGIGATSLSTQRNL